jgi:hypothetical protein
MGDHSALTGTRGSFDPKEDKPVMEGGKPVMAEVKME